MLIGSECRTIVHVAATAFTSYSHAQGGDKRWIEQRINEDERIPAARDIAFEYYLVLHRLQDFLGEIKASDDPDDDPVPGFDKVAARVNVVGQVTTLAGVQVL